MSPDQWFPLSTLINTGEGLLRQLPEFTENCAGGGVDGYRHAQKVRFGMPSLINYLRDSNYQVVDGKIQHVGLYQERDDPRRVKAVILDRGTYRPAVNSTLTQRLIVEIEIEDPLLIWLPDLLIMLNQYLCDIKEEPELLLGVIGNYGWQAGMAALASTQDIGYMDAFSELKIKPIQAGFVGIDQRGKVLLPSNSSLYPLYRTRDPFPANVVTKERNELWKKVKDLARKSFASKIYYRNLLELITTLAGGEEWFLEYGVEANTRLPVVIKTGTITVVFPTDIEAGIYEYFNTHEHNKVAPRLSDINRRGQTKGTFVPFPITFFVTPKEIRYDLAEQLTTHRFFQI